MNCTCASMYLPMPSGPVYELDENGVVTMRMPSAAVSAIAGDCPVHPRPPVPQRKKPEVASWRRVLLRLAGYEWVLDEEW